MEKKNTESDKEFPVKIERLGWMSIKNISTICFRSFSGDVSDLYGGKNNQTLLVPVISLTPLQKMRIPLHPM